MPENNKILEVTYGKFSCRLEGFEDSVETMKAVVAYFHELGGHENFMDMQPQAPDMETLARLAQTQADGLVEVEETADGISLRVTSSEQNEDAVSNEAAEVDASVEDLSEEDHDDTEEADQEDALEAEDDYSDFAEDEATQITDEDAAEVADTADSFAAFAAATADDDADAIVVAEEEDNSFAGSSEATEEVEDGTVSETSTAPVSEASIADKLQRIRAVVGRSAPDADDEDYSEDLSEPAPVKEPRAANPLAQRLAELAKRNAELMDADEQEESAEVETAQIDDVDDAHDDFEDVMQDEDPVEDTWEAADEDDADIEDVAQVEDDDDQTDDDDSLIAAEDDAEPDYAEDTAEDAGESEDDLMDETEDDDAPISRTTSATRPLLLTTRQSDSKDDSDDDEDNDSFDLKAELAEIEREIAARPGNEVARHGLPRSVEDAMSRILNETNEQLDAPEGRRHRDAFTQLKAAVAATEASRQLGDVTKSRDMGAVFRDDLGALNAEGKAKGEGLPPLKLVTPIDDDEDEDSRPVSMPLDVASERLREIASKVASRDVSEDQSFAAFAQAHGTEDLADMLEAAAAYIAYVEGESDFSRPQVMKVVQSASSDEISREDGLRSFGRLLRQSRIVKLNNGRFQVAENTRFRPNDPRAAQG